MVRKKDTPIPDPTPNSSRRTFPHRNSAVPRPRFRSRWRLLVPAVFLVFAIILLSWYYKPAKIWYRERRKERVLQETLAGIKRYNTDLRHEISSLETTEGVKDYAKRELNLVERGDHSIVVTRNGVPLKAVKNTREAVLANLPQTVQPFGSWTDFLDSLFGIEK